MKRLITLIFSAALLCPMWAGAQTTPTVIGPVNWVFSGYDNLIGNITPLTIQGLSGIYLVNTAQSISVNITNPQNTEGMFSISGYANTFQAGGAVPVTPVLPITGSMVSVLSNNQYSDNSASTYGYIVTLYIGTTVITCGINPYFLQGMCTNSSKQSFSIKKAS